MTTQERIGVTITKTGPQYKEDERQGEVVRVTAWAVEGSRPTLLIAPYAVPDHIEAEVTFGDRLRVQLDIAVVNGRAGVRRVTISAPDGRPLSATDTRIPLRQYAAEAMELLAGELRIRDDGTFVLVAVVPGPEGSSLRFHAAAEKASRSKVDDARLREVARVHDAAPPRGCIAAVAKHEDIHPRYAQTLIRLARKGGFIQREER